MIALSTTAGPPAAEVDKLDKLDKRARRDSCAPIAVAPEGTPSVDFRVPRGTPAAGLPSVADTAGAAARISDG